MSIINELIQRYDDMTYRTNIQVAAEAFAVLRDMATFDRLGGSDTFFGRLHVFKYLLKDEHAKAGETDSAKGAYRYRGMMQYGNIVSYEPSMSAAKRFIEMGYSEQHLMELQKWYRGKNVQGSVDAVALAIYLSEFLTHEFK